MSLTVMRTSTYVMLVQQTIQSEQPTTNYSNPLFTVLSQRAGAPSGSCAFAGVQIIGSAPSVYSPLTLSDKT